MTDAAPTTAAEQDAQQPLEQPAPFEWNAPAQQAPPPDPASAFGIDTVAVTTAADLALCATVAAPAAMPGQACVAPLDKIIKSARSMAGKAAPPTPWADRIARNRTVCHRPDMALQPFFASRRNMTEWNGRHIDAHQLQPVYQGLCHDRNAADGLAKEPPTWLQELLP
jgi:hypothetical protein